MKPLILSLMVMLFCNCERERPKRAARAQFSYGRTAPRCHSIDKASESPLKIAPPFRTLHLRYPVESLQESFAKGIRTGHDNMPEFRLDADQIGDAIAYLKTLER
jgi:cytochrome c